MVAPIVPLKCGAQDYAWGLYGSSSAVGRFLAATGSSIDESKPYAELWMGTHGKMPSYTPYPKNPKAPKGEVLELLEVLKQDEAQFPEPERKEGEKEKKEESEEERAARRKGALLGAKNTIQNLPFLFKVLSIGKALSIQAHPNKQRAPALYAKDSTNYPDGNHKPEMAIALTPFAGFCGFRPLPEIAQFLKDPAYPEFRTLVTDPIATSFVETAAASATKERKQKTDAETKAEKDALKEVFKAMMTADEEKQVKPLLSALVKRMKDEGAKPAEGQSPQTIPELIVRLDEQFPGDVGVFCTFVLNWVKLEVGEGMFLAANEPHAYLEGDIIECMATSDNVVRAGLTPKFRDVDELVSMLTYKSNPPDDQKLDPKDFAGSSSTKLYKPDKDFGIDEFAVLLTTLAKGGKDKHRALEGPSIIIVTEGSGKLRSGSCEEAAGAGKVLFVGAGHELQVEAGEEGFTVFRAFTEYTAEDVSAGPVKAQG